MKITDKGFKVKSGEARFGVHYAEHGMKVVGEALKVE